MNDKFLHFKTFSHQMFQSKLLTLEHILLILINNIVLHIGVNEKTTQSPEILQALLQFSLSKLEMEKKDYVMS